MFRGFYDKMKHEYLKMNHTYLKMIFIDDKIFNIFVMI